VIATQREAANTFDTVAEAWIECRSAKSAAPTLAKNRWLLDHSRLPALGTRPIRSVTARDLLDTLRAIEATGKLEAAKRAKTKAGEIFRYAVLEGLADSDPTASLKGALKFPNTRHRPSITEPAKIGELMRAIHGYPNHLVRNALLLLAMTFVRPGELRHALREEFDLDATEGAIWRISAERMKRKSAHLVPLSGQATDLLRDQQGITGVGALLFLSASPHGGQRGAVLRGARAE
jgi:integrase